MKTENHAWNLLRELSSRAASSQFRRTACSGAARVGVEAAPSLFGHFVLSAVTAAACFVVVAIFQASISAADSPAHNLADWQQVASAMDDSSLAQ